MIKSANLVWVSVSDIKKAKKFFVDTLGLKELSFSEEWGWAELSGKEGGTMIGLAQADKDLPPGSNAITTFSVDNIEVVRDELKKKGVTLIGEIIEVPGHVKMQMFTDLDGNKFQLVQTL